jgi:hypothetical protein
MPLLEKIVTTTLRGVELVRVDLARGGASRVISVTLVSGLNYSGWACKAEATASTKNSKVTLSPVVTADSAGRTVVTITLSSTAMYGLQFEGVTSYDFDSRYVEYPKDFRIEAWMERDTVTPSTATLNRDVFLRGSVTLSTPQPKYIHAVSTT